MQPCRFFPPYIIHLISYMGGCFGCLTKPSVVVTVDEPAKGLGNQDCSARKYSISDDLWSSSAAEMEHSTVKSQKSPSSVSPLSQPLDLCCNPSSTNNSSEFVNHGLLLWNQMRRHWLGNKRSGNRTRLREPTIRWNVFPCY